MGITAVTQNVLLVVGFLLFNVVIFLAWDLYKKRHILRFAKDLNGADFYPIIGNGYQLFGINIFTGVQKVVRKYGLPCNIWAGHEYHYITANAAEIKIVLNHPSTFNKSAIYEEFRLAFKNTLLMAEVNYWKKNRKIFSRSFSQPILNGFVDIFFQKCCILVDVLKKSQPCEIFDIFSRFTLDNFCANIMRIDLNVQVDFKNELMEATNRIQNILGKRMMSCYLLPQCIWLYTPDGRTCLKDYDKTKEIIYKIIQKKRKEFQENKEFIECSDKLLLMDMMLEAEGVTFTDEEIFCEIFLFMLAATDTTGNTLAFVFTLLGMHPEVQEKVYEEVIENVGADGAISHADLPNLKYTERAIFETMRLLPVTPILGRSTTTDVDLGTRIIPAGSNIDIAVFNLHRSEQYWTKPLEYNPDRFLPEEVAKRDPYAFIPFSGGPRNCIGKTYATMLMKTAVAHVIRTYKIESNYKSVEDLELESCITMKTVHDLDCRFNPR